MLPSSITNLQLQDRFRSLLNSSAVRRLRIVGAVFLGLLLLDVLVYAAVVAPASARLEEQHRRYQDLKRQYADALLFKKQKEALAGLQRGIPTQKDVPLLIKELVQSARRLNLRAGAINSDIPTPGSGGLAMLTFSVPLSGSYGNIKRFIYDVESSDRLIGIQDVKLETENDKGAVSVKVQMKLITYIRSE